MDVLWKKMVLSPRNPWLPHKSLHCLWRVVDCLILYRSSGDNHRYWVLQCHSCVISRGQRFLHSPHCPASTFRPTQGILGAFCVHPNHNNILCNVSYSGLTSYYEVFSGVLLMQDSVRFHAFHLVLMTLRSPLLNSPPLSYLPLCCWWSGFSLKG